MSNKNEQVKGFQELIDIMALLRSEKGCPWDRKQTPDSLKKHILEEAYEVLEAIDGGQPDEVCDELGDLLLQVIFQAQIHCEAGQFSIADVAESINNKLKRRHPHIFADASHEDHEQRWEEIKQQERLSNGKENTLAQRIPHTLPALKRGTKVAKKSKMHRPLEIVHQMRQQLELIEQELSCPDQSSTKIEHHFSQLLLGTCFFAAANNLDAEDLLRLKTNQLITEIDSKNEVY